MTSIAKQASALFLVLCFSAYSDAQDTTQITTQTHVISDDGYVNVPLQFEFPYYGQTFTNSWMFSNGIISFQDPAQSGLSWSNLNVQDFSSAMGPQFNYSIFPLWTDLININGSFTSQGDSQFQRYNWIGISPFYDANRLNTFSVEIRPDGQIIANYSLIDVDYAKVGTVGDASKGEFEQIYSSPGSIINWERYTSGTVSLEPSTPTSMPTVIPRVEILETNTGVEVNLIAQPMEMSASTESTSERSGTGISLSSVLNILAREQARVSAIERSTVESSVEQSITQAQQALEQAQDVAAGARADAHTAEIVTQQSERSNASISANVTTTSSISRTDPNTKSHDTDTTTGSGSNDAMSVTGFSAVDTLRSEPHTVVDDSAREQKSLGTRSGTSDNELAGGVTLAALGAPPMGFQTYQVMMPDAAFYAPREIYPGQQTVDNIRALRGLGSDQSHQLMIDQQYRR